MEELWPLFPCDLFLPVFTVFYELFPTWSGHRVFLCEASLPPPFTKEFRENTGFSERGTVRIHCDRLLNTGTSEWLRPIPEEKPRFSEPWPGDWHVCDPVTVPIRSSAILLHGQTDRPPVTVCGMCSCEAAGSGGSLLQSH